MRNPVDKPLNLPIAEEAPREMPPKVEATVDLGWSMSGSTGAPEARVAPDPGFRGQLPYRVRVGQCGHRCPRGKPLIACVGPVATPSVIVFRGAAKAAG